MRLNYTSIGFYLSSLACLCVFLFIFIGLPFVSASTSLSVRADDIFSNRASIARNLLQVKKECPVNFEAQDYTIITNKCKGPNYPAKLCCDALKEFACPFTEEINRGDNTCATIMFSYINGRGRYPAGLFANECQGDKLGLLCNAPPPSSQTTDDHDHGNGIKWLPSSFSILISSFVVLAALIQLF